MNAMRKVERRKQVDEEFWKRVDLELRTIKEKFAHINWLNNQKKKHPTLFTEGLL